MGKDDEYNQLEKYKHEGKVNKVSKLYDKMIADEPYNIQYMLDKADYLKDKDKYVDALNECNHARKINPYSEKVYEMYGDVYKEEEEKDSAWYYYKKAKYYFPEQSVWRTRPREKNRPGKRQQAAEKAFYFKNI